MKKILFVFFEGFQEQFLTNIIEKYDVIKINLNDPMYFYFMGLQTDDINNLTDVINKIKDIIKKNNIEQTCLFGAVVFYSLQII